MDASKMKKLLRDGPANELNDYGTIYLQNREFEKAIKLFSKALALAQVQLGEKHLETGEIYKNLGLAWYWRTLLNLSQDFDKASEFKLPPRPSPSQSRANIGREPPHHKNMLHQLWPHRISQG